LDTSFLFKLLFYSPFIIWQAFFWIPLLSVKCPVNIFTNILQTNMALDISYLLAFVCLWKWFSDPWICHNYPKLLKLGFHGSKHIAFDPDWILAFGSKDASLIIHSISGRILKACNRTKSFLALLRTILTLRLPIVKF